MARQNPETTIPVDGQKYKIGRKKGVYNAATDAFVVRGKIVPRAETPYAAPPGHTTPGLERTMEEREAILNTEIAAYIAVNPRSRSVVDRTNTTAHMKNNIRESFLYLSVFLAVITLGLSLLIDIPLRILLRLFGAKIYDHTTIAVLPDGRVQKTNS